MKCLSCDSVADQIALKSGICSRCGEQLKSTSGPEVATPLVFDREKHAYVTPFGRHVAQRQRSGAWAVGYQLAPADDHSEPIARVISELAVSASGLQHPSLAMFHSVDQVEHRLVWKLPDLPLVPLTSFEVPLRSKDAEALIRTVATAVDVLHQGEMGAFDLSPALIFTESTFREAVLVPTLTLAAQACRNPGDGKSVPFTAPELGGALDGLPNPVRADLYSLGALAWYLLTGTERWQHPTTLPSEHSTELVSWDTFIDGCCRTRPERRFGTISEALESLISGRAGQAVSPSSRITKQQVTPPQKSEASRPSSPYVAPVTTTQLARPRSGYNARLIWIAVALVVGIAVYLRRDQIASAIPGASGLLVDYQRGFGDTVLKYSDRSYEGTAWKKVQGSDSLSLVASLGSNEPAIELTQIVGWDEDHLWVLDVRGLVFRLRNGTWTFLTRCEETRYPVGTALTSDKILLAGRDFRNHLYEVSSSGKVDLGQLFKTTDWAIRPHAVAPDLYYVFSEYHDFMKISDGTVTQMPEDKYKEAYVSRSDNTPLKEFPAKRVRGVKSHSVGRAIGIVDPEWGEGNRKVVSFQNGVWYEADELPDKKSFNESWLSGQGNVPNVLILVGEGGYVLAHTVHGKSIQQSVTSLQESTSLKLISVWGVDLNKYWVMDDSGTVWERDGNESRVVVRGMYRDDVKFRHAWVSPRGTVYAVTETDLYRLE